MKRILPLLLCTLLSFAISAQKDQTVMGHRGLGLTGIWGGSTSFFNASSENNNFYSGGFFTFELNKNVLLGWNNYQLGNIINDSRVNIKSHEFLLGYSPLSYKAIHPYFYTAIGNAKLNIEDEGKGKAISFQPSVAMEINVLRWLRLSLEGGYRMISGSNFKTITDNDMSGAFVGLRAKFGWSWGR